MCHVDLTSKCDSLDFFVIMPPSLIMSRQKIHTFTEIFQWKYLQWLWRRYVIVGVGICSWYFLINHSTLYHPIIQIPDMWSLPVWVREDWLATVDDVIRHSLSQHFSPPCLIFLHHYREDRSLSIAIAEFESGISQLFSLWNTRALVVFGRRSLTSSATISLSLLRHLRFIPI